MWGYTHAALELCPPHGDTLAGPRAASPACVQVHSLPGTKQTAPQGCIFTACRSDCVYSNGLNWISGCEANLLIVFPMMPWAAQGGWPPSTPAGCLLQENYRGRCGLGQHLELLPSCHQAVPAHWVSLQLVQNVNNWKYQVLKANPCTVQT